MSTKAKLTLAGTSLGALGIIVFVHYSQKAEKAVRSCSLPAHCV
jgi:protein PET117